MPVHLLIEQQAGLVGSTVPAMLGGCWRTTRSPELRRTSPPGSMSMLCTDRSGARLVLPRGAARGPVHEALAYQRKHHLPPAKVSRFAAMGLELAPSDLRFRAVRTLLLIAGLIAYTAIVCWLMVKGIPALAPGH
jgi:hypothetical protein